MDSAAGLHTKNSLNQCPPPLQKANEKKLMKDNTNSVRKKSQLCSSTVLQLFRTQRKFFSCALHEIFENNKNLIIKKDTKI